MRLKVALTHCLLGLWGGQGRAADSVFIPAGPVSTAAFDQAGLQAAVFFFLPEIQFGAIQAARGRSFGPHRFTDGSGNDLTFQAGCVVPGDLTDRDGDGLAASFDTTFDCLDAPFFLTPLSVQWTVTDLDDADPHSGYTVSGQEVENFTGTMHMTHSFQFELNPLRGATYRADLIFRIQDVQASPVKTYEQLRRLNLVVLRRPDADGQGVQLSLSGETSVADDMLLTHSHGVARIRGELHYSARCGESGGIDSGNLTLSSGTLSAPGSGSGTASSATTTTSAGLTGSGDGLGINLGYSSTTTTVTATNALSPALAALLNQFPAATTTLTYTGCNTPK